MAELKGSSARPLKVFVRYGMPAERITRKHAAHGGPISAYEQERATAASFKARPELNLHDRGGKIITDLVYTNFFVGGAVWDSRDRQNIDTALAKAMSDQRLNNVLIQYFRGAAHISTEFRASNLLPGDPPAEISQTDVEQLVLRLHSQGTLNGFDLGKTLFNFMLPRGTVLTIDDGSGERRGDTDEKASSLQGLGGFHGAVQSDATNIYYAVGVFSEGNNGITAFNEPWKNVVATFYHELNEARTDADVEASAVAWVNDEQPSEEIGDIPMSVAGANLGLVMKEVPLTDATGTVPIQLMWSNAVSAPEGPIATPHRPS